MTAVAVAKEKAKLCAEFKRHTSAGSELSRMPSGEFRELEELRVR